MAPSPKPPGQRRRRNVGQSQWQELPGSGRVGPAPDLPEGDWLPSTLEWWARIWSSPMAAVWLPADVEALVRLARLRDKDARGKLPQLAYSAIQQIEDRFGLSPKARRQLQWEISQAEEPAAQVAPSNVRRLRAVDAA